MGGEQLATLMTAEGFALTKMLLDGLTQQADWFYLSVAAISLGYAALRAGLTDEGLPFFARHLAAVLVASLLLYLPVTVGLSSITASDTYNTQPQQNEIASQGALPIPTYVVEMVGTAMTDTARKIVAGDAPILPGLRRAVEDNMRSGDLLNDKQVLANALAWRQVVAPAILLDRPDLAAELEKKGLTKVFFNPVSDDPSFVPADAAKQAGAVIALLKSSKIDLKKTICLNAQFINNITRELGAKDWLVGTDKWDTSCEGTIYVPQIEADSQDRVQNIGAFALSVATNTKKTMYNAGVSALSAIATGISAIVSSAAVDGTDDLYRKLGNSVLYAGAAETGAEADNLALLGALCNQTSNDTCVKMHSALYAGLETKLAQKRSEGKSNWLAAGAASFVLTAISTLLNILAGLIVGILPLCLGVAKMICLVLSIIGVYMLLIPGRYQTAMEWMIGPVTWANLWNILFIVWWKIEILLDGLSDTLFGAGSPIDGFNAAEIIRLVSSAGYLALPVLAWQIVFGGAGGALLGAGTRMIEHGIGSAGRGAGRTAGKGAEGFWDGHAKAGNDKPPPNSGPGSPRSGGSFPSNPPSGPGRALSNAPISSAGRVGQRQ